VLVLNSVAFWNILTLKEMCQVLGSEAVSGHPRLLPASDSPPTSDVFHCSLLFLFKNKIGATLRRGFSFSPRNLWFHCQLISWLKVMYIVWLHIFFSVHYCNKLPLGLTQLGVPQILHSIKIVYVIVTFISFSLFILSQKPKRQENLLLCAIDHALNQKSPKCWWDSCFLTAPAFPQ
jgi:hypothetical protein